MFLCLKIYSKICDNNKLNTQKRERGGKNNSRIFLNKNFFLAFYSVVFLAVYRCEKKILNV